MGKIEQKVKRLAFMYTFFQWQSGDHRQLLVISSNLGMLKTAVTQTKQAAIKINYT
jgi:hypothetical protein